MKKKTDGDFSLLINEEGASPFPFLKKRKMKTNGSGDRKRMLQKYKQYKRYCLLNGRQTDFRKAIWKTLTQKN